MQSSSTAQLTPQQIKQFRTWIVTVVEDQVSRGANPRWHHRDCAGLLRFAVHESLADHGPAWRKANGLLSKPLPGEISLSNDERQNFKLWKAADDKKSEFVRALPLVQRNTEFIGKTIERIEPGDLLFFDQGDEQHIMIWTGRRIVYHNGHRPHKNEKSRDQGLRAVSLDELMNFSDSRWQPRMENPNFVGFYRLSFLQKTASHLEGTL